MPKVIFKFNKEKDLWNNWDTINSSSPWGGGNKKNSVLSKMCKGKKLKECKKDLEKFYKSVYESKLLSLIIESFQKAWDEISNEFFIRLKKITKKSFPFDKITAYLTMQLRCPYDFDKPWFMVSMFRSIPSVLETCGHELMHIHFHYYYWKKAERKIGKVKTADLKESLTALLNSEFKDLWFVRDEGYPKHKKLRQFIEKEWKKQKDFDILLQRCIEYLK